MLCTPHRVPKQCQFQESSMTCISWPPCSPPSPKQKEIRGLCEALRQKFDDLAIRTAALEAEVSELKKATENNAEAIHQMKAGEDKGCSGKRLEFWGPLIDRFARNTFLSNDYSRLSLKELDVAVLQG
ncbi:hypothetical protein NDU88_006107 [Pleurodeles waltl]|uniref:Uncharacterized protein n=1 Tax=Pleurodeles waltl TaxID=8319 RepID=A0AAV7WCZ8_PLEWA|nr:hypothetical protein NDU88_006107 [Pleurodeles waltl]